MTARRSRHCWLQTCSSNSFAFLLCDKYVLFLAKSHPFQKIV
jgi:hypothetical protein